MSGVYPITLRVSELGPFRYLRAPEPSPKGSGGACTTHIGMLARQLSPQVAQEVHDLGTLDRPGIQPEVERPHGDSCDHRQALPVEG
jgi:hypothetical protein